MQASKTLADSMKNASPMRYREHPEIVAPRSRNAIIEAARVELGQPSTKLAGDAEADLFKALHAAAYMMVTQPAGRTPGEPREPWSVFFQRVADRLVQANLGLVYEMRRRAGVRGIDEDELNSTGMWSLYQAVLGFDPWRGYRFSTYACNVLVRAYRHLWKRGVRQGRHLQVFHDRRAREAELDAREDEDRALMRDRLARVLERNDAQLTATERFVIERRFLNEAAERQETLAKVGKAISLGKERVRQIQVAALTKLQMAMKDDPVLKAANLV